MKFDLPAPLRQPTLWFATSLLLGGSVFHLALDTRAQSESRQLTAQSVADQAERDRRQALGRLAQDRAQASTYASLDRSGFLGGEDRLNWISSLARLRASLNLQQLTWRLGPRAASSLGTGLYSSAMVVDLAPVDVDRLGLFLAQLRGIAHGRFTVRECSLRPDAGGKQGTATCTLDWWTWHGE